MIYNTTELLRARRRVDQIYDDFKPSSKVVARRRRDVLRDGGATRGAGVTRGTGARTCLQSSYNAKLLLLRKNNAITQNY